MSDLDDDPAAIAKSRGQEIIESDANHLQLDLDGHDAALSFVLEKLHEQKVINREDTLETRSLSGNKHLYIRLVVPIESGEQRIALQAALGSDRRREAFSLMRILRKTHRVASLLFETPEEAERVRVWLAAIGFIGG